MKPFLNWVEETKSFNEANTLKNMLGAGALALSGMMGTNNLHAQIGVPNQKTYIPDWYPGKNEDVAIEKIRKETAKSIAVLEEKVKQIVEKRDLIKGQLEDQKNKRTVDYSKKINSYFSNLFDDPLAKEKIDKSIKNIEIQLHKLKEILNYKLKEKWSRDRIDDFTNLLNSLDLKFKIPKSPAAESDFEDDEDEDEPLDEKGLTDTKKKRGWTGDNLKDSENFHIFPTHNSSENYIINADKIIKDKMFEKFTQKYIKEIERIEKELKKGNYK